MLIVDTRTNILGCKENWNMIENYYYSYLKGKNGTTASKGDFDPNLLNSRANQIEKVVFWLSNCASNPSSMSDSMNFDTSNQYLRPWRMIEESSKITVFAYWAKWIGLQCHPKIFKSYSEYHMAFQSLQICLRQCVLISEPIS